MGCHYYNSHNEVFLRTFFTLYTGSASCPLSFPRGRIVSSRQHKLFSPLKHNARSTCVYSPFLWEPQTKITAVCLKSVFPVPRGGGRPFCQHRMDMLMCPEAELVLMRVPGPAETLQQLQCTFLLGLQRSRWLEVIQLSFLTLTSPTHHMTGYQIIRFQFLVLFSYLLPFEGLWSVPHWLYTKYCEEVLGPGSTFLFAYNTARCLMVSQDHYIPMLTNNT